MCFDCSWARLTEFQKYLIKLSNKMSKDIIIDHGLKYILSLVVLAVTLPKYTKLGFYLHL